MLRIFNPSRKSFYKTWHTCGPSGYIVQSDAFMQTNVQGCNQLMDSKFYRKRNYFRNPSRISQAQISKAKLYNILTSRTTLITNTSNANLIFPKDKVLKSSIVHANSVRKFQTQFFYLSLHIRLQKNMHTKCQHRHTSHRHIAMCTKQAINIIIVPHNICNSRRKN